jgi:hypothetical protein
MNNKDFVEKEMNLISGIKEFLALNGYDDYRVILSALSVMLTELIGMTMTEKEAGAFMALFAKGITDIQLEFAPLREKEN